MWTRYPRTPHLPWSPGATTDDVRTGDLTGLTGQEVVVTEKLDGENTTLYPDGLHARSPDSGHHPSRAWVKGRHERIAQAIPPGWRVCGENLHARHSIGYDALASWFYAFSVWAGEHCLDWDATVRFTRRLGVPVPPVLWRGRFDVRTIRALRLDLDRQEGYVVRTVAGFTRAEFPARVAKWVRPSHVQTDTHWMTAPVVPNGRGPAAPLWDVRSGAPPDPPALTAALRQPLGLPLARRVADLVGRHTTVHRPYPDEQRRAGLVRLAGVARVLRRIGPPSRPSTARSMALATAGGSGTRTTLPPLPRTRRARWPCSSPRSPMSVPQASKIRRPRRPRRPSMAIRAKSFGLVGRRAVVIRASNWRSPRPRVGDSGGTTGRRT
ncbi:RNA ligase family protein [Micromonospora sp. B11E3]|uniref:RNA ligase family protein n=1 Tax=Micromonospora sp. B11E3 TaxID=3153562 RepID=UPI00325D7E4D